MNDRPAVNPRLATAGGLTAILLWSTTVSLARSLAEQLGPVTAAAAVYAVGGILALGSLPGRTGQGWRLLALPLRYLLGCGALFVGYMLALYLAVGWAGSRQQVLEVGLVNYLWPALTILFSVPLLGNRASWILLPGTILALAGAALVVNQGGPFAWQSLAGNFAANPVVYGLAAAAAVAWALYSNLTRRWAAGQREGAVKLFIPATAVVLLAVSLLGDEPRQWSLGAAVEAVFLGAATYFGYALWDQAMRRGDLVLVATASYLTPLFSTLVSCLYLSVKPGMNLWGGCLLLVAGSLLSWYAVGGNRVPPPAGDGP